MPRIPQDAGPDTQRTLRQIWEQLEALQTRNQNLHGLRITNTGEPRARADYTNKGYVDDLVASAIEEALTPIEGQLRVLSGGTGTSTGGGGGGGGGGTTPPTGTPIDFGYYRVDVGASGTPAQASQTVKAWTNITYCGPFSDWGGVSGTPLDDVVTAFSQSVSRIYAAGLNIMLDLDMKRVQALGLNVQTWCRALFQVASAGGNWGKVKYLVLGDEMTDSSVTVNGWINDVRAACSAAGVNPVPPIGANLGFNIGSNEIRASNVDFIGFEAYSENTQTANVPAITARVAADAQSVPADKFLVLIMQAYDYSGAFTDTATLIELNRATYYDMVQGKSRYKALMMFNWARDGNSAGTGDPFGHGTSGYPQLQSVHQGIWASMSGTSSSGPKKCSNPRPGQDCSGTPGELVPCCAGDAPCNCPRMCAFPGGQYAAEVEAGITDVVANHQELFVDGVLTGIPNAPAIYRDYLICSVNTNSPVLQAVRDENNGNQMLVRQRSNPEFNVHYRVINSALTIARPSGSGYECTCWPASEGWPTGATPDCP